MGTGKPVIYGCAFWAAVAVVAFIMRPAHAHTMSATECHTLAWDAKQAANDRAVATQKMQLAVMAQTLEMCRERTPITCIYQDDADDTQAMGILNWMYEQMGLTPKQIHDKVEADCNERLMESVRQMHGGANELLRGAE